MVILQEGEITLNHLLFADDLAICAGSQKDLQRLLNVVYMYSGKWRFKFNIVKSNVMIVSGKDQQRQLEYFLGFDPLKVVKTCEIVSKQKVIKPYSSLLYSSQTPA